MPRMDQAPPSSRLIKLLLIGDGKVGKTFYAGESAKHFNMLYINGDVGGQTLSQLDMAIQRNIYLMEAGDTILGGRKDTKFIETIQDFITTNTIRWNDDDQRPATRKDTDKTIWEITPGKMDPNTVLVIDSWTSLIESMMQQAGTANGLFQLADATTSQMRPVYQSGGAKATAILQVIRAIPCHVIVLAHPDEYQHKTAPEGKRVQDVKETDMVIDWTKAIPKSTSKPHGLLLPKYFTDVAWIEMNPSGSTRYINFKQKDDRVAGGHFADRKNADDYSFANLVKAIGGSVPDKAATPDSWLKIVPPGESVEAEPKVLDGTKEAPVKGVSSLFKKG